MAFNLFCSGSVETSSQQRILAALLEKYDADGRPSSDKSRAVLVTFGAKLVRIIDLVKNIVKKCFLPPRRCYARKFFL